MKTAQWKLYTPGLLREIANGSGQGIYKIPLNLLRVGLCEIAERAAELNDPDLNSLMLQMGMYSAGDPESPEFDGELVERMISERLQRRAEKAITAAEKPASR
jgi:hypothetical protein